MRILLIEDDDSLRRAMEAVLGLQGHEVVSAVNGVDGLGHFHEGDFHVVVTDLLMSYGGLTTIRMLRQIRPNLAIVAISCSATHLKKACELGADESVLKPFAPEDLQSAVASAAAKRAGVHAAVPGSAVDRA